VEDSWLLSPPPPLGGELRLRIDLESPAPNDVPVEFRVLSSPESVAHQLGDRSVDTWLVLAVGRNDPDLIRVFLERGAQPNVRGDYGYAPLMIAALNRDQSLVRTLLDRGAALDVKNQAGATALFYAIFGGGQAGTEIAQLLLAHGADANLGGPAIGRPIDWAAQYGEADAVRSLLACGARPRASALHSAIEHEHPEVAALLKKAMRR
jgi:ankyrin repeat protein